MPLDKSFLSMMPDTITVYAQSGTDKYGKRSHSATGTSYRCRIEQTSQLIRDAEGREVVAVGKVYLYGAPSLTIGTKVTLPDGSTPVVVAVNQNNDDKGGHHTVLMLGR